MQQVYWFGGCDELEAHELFPNEFVVNTEYDEKDFTYVTLNHGKSVIEYSAADEIYEIFTERKSKRLKRILDQDLTVGVSLFIAYGNLSMFEEQREMIHELAEQLGTSFAVALDCMSYQLRHKRPHSL